MKTKAVAIMAKKKNIEEKKEALEEKQEKEESAAEEAAEEAPAEAKKSARKAITRKREKKEKISPLEKEIRLLIESGKIGFGTRKGMAAVLVGKAKGIIYASNIPRDVMDDIRYYGGMEKGLANLPFSGTSVELGKLCGKPYPVSIIAIYDFGETTKDRLEKLTK
jgi:large subunit ribosomal protein L30e